MLEISVTLQVTLDGLIRADLIIEGLGDGDEPDTERDVMWWTSDSVVDAIAAIPDSCAELMSK